MSDFYWTILRSDSSFKYRLYTEVEELCDLFTKCRMHEVNKKQHNPETEVYNMLLLWGIFTKQWWFAALETHSN